MRLDGAVGPGRGLAAELEDVDIVATIACGDDYFAEHEGEALATLLGYLEEDRPDVLVAGPAFGSGPLRLRLRDARAAAAERGIPSVAAMHPENPGVDAAGKAYVVPTAVNVAGMRDALPRLARVASALAAGRELGAPDEEGYLPRGFRRNYFAEKTGAERAIDLLLAKLGGGTRTEVGGGLDRVEPPAPVPDLSEALVALVTEAGACPRATLTACPPCGRRGGSATRSTGRRRYRRRATSPFMAASTSRSRTRIRTGSSRSTPRATSSAKVVSAGSTTPSTPRRAMGRLSSPSTRFGREIAGELREAGVGAVLLSGT